MALANKLKKIREQRGWTIYAACAQTSSVGRTSLTRLEDDESDPLNVRLETALQLIHLYWPDLELSDFMPKNQFNRYVIKRKRN